MGMDLAALKYLLYDVGVPPDIKAEIDYDRSVLWRRSDRDTRLHPFPSSLPTVYDQDGLPLRLPSLHDGRRPLQKPSVQSTEGEFAAT